MADALNGSKENAVGPADEKAAELPTANSTPAANATMRLAAYVFMGYCALRGIAMLAKPARVYELFPALLIESNPETNQVALAYARALGVLIFACGMLCLGGVKGRIASLCVIFPMFFVNHVIDGVAFPPLVPVVAVNVLTLSANLYEVLQGSDKTPVGKWSYFLMQGLFGLLFLCEPPFLVQDPFTFAVAGTDALHVGRKLGSIVGMVLCMHASVTLFQVPTGPLFAMGVLSCGFVKMAFMDGIPLPPAPLGAAGVCIVLCLYDYLMNTTKGKKE